MNHPDLSPDGSPREPTWRNAMRQVIGHNAINKCTTATHMDANHPRPSPSPTCEVNQTFPGEWLTAKLCGQFKDLFRQKLTSHFNFILNTQTPTLTLDVFTCRFDIFDFFLQEKLRCEQFDWISENPTSYPFTSSSKIIHPIRSLHSCEISLWEVILFQTAFYVTILCLLA